MSRWLSALVISFIFTISLFGDAVGVEERERSPILIGLDADLSSGSKESGVAILRGIELAMDEINAGGGVLGRSLSLVVRDHQGNPTRGIDNIHELAEMRDLVAVVGGLHTPVALAELAAIHKHGVIYLGPWAAGTLVVDNGYSPNYVFRVSVRDALAGGYLIDQALKRGFQNPALLLENTGWGRSNEKAMKEALAHYGRVPATVQWFNWGVQEISGQLRAIDSVGADVIILVANAPEGAVVINALSSLPGDSRRTVISHWGITGGCFFKETQGVINRTNLLFLQTFSFLATATDPLSARLAEAYMARYDDCSRVDGIRSPVGTAHAFDLLQLLARAIEAAGSIERSRVRDALEQIRHYPGLVRDYAPPFTPQRHDALDRDDFHLARYDEEGIIRWVEEK